MVWYLIVGYAIRGGVEDRRLEVKAKAKDTKKFRGQGQRQSLSRLRPRTKNTGASILQKKKFLKKFSSNLKKRSSKIFFRRKRSSKIFFFRQFPLEKNKKRSTQIYCKVSGAFQQNFNGSKNSALLEPRTGQFSRT